MDRYEYKVVPAPKRGEKVRGARQTEDRFAQALMTVMNRLGRDGWEYLRAETLPCEERSGLTGRTTAFQNMLVFRRRVGAGAEADGEQALPEREPLSEAAEAKLASIHAVPPRKDGPRLVSTNDEGGNAPSLGPAERGADKRDDAAE
ncbi:DUF4177 domain-containing protein [Acidimangrovimonas pyrenivorans]|uniref:DUF4177 domain-containing protein n=1 Tax=Acidimangrovimonas pyrenivorans TaxID=2030798 RepID=A0ABV7AIQ3_9RHOB